MSALVQQTEEWLEMRKNYIGASDAPVLMEVSPWSTPYKLWCEKLSLLPPKKKTEAMQRGLDLEEEARKEFEKQTGLIMFPTVVFSDEYDFMMASLDGIDIEGKNILEIKCPGKEDHECAMDGVIPEKYMPQLQHQMIVTKLDKVWYFSYSKNSHKLIEVERDTKYAKKLIEKEKSFWRCVKELEAPPLTERDFIERSDDMWVSIASEWKQVQSSIRKLEALEKSLRNDLILISGGHNVVGAGIRMSKVVRKGNVEYKDIPELKDVNLDMYRKEPVESWRINCV